MAMQLEEPRPESIEMIVWKLEQRVKELERKLEGTMKALMRD